HDPDRADGLGHGGRQAEEPGGGVRLSPEQTSRGGGGRRGGGPVVASPGVSRAMMIGRSRGRRGAIVRGRIGARKEGARRVLARGVLVQCAMPRVFVDYWEAGEFAVTLELALVEDGSFTLSESWSCYAGGTGYAAQGRWTEAGGAIALAVESSDLRE